MAYFVLATWLLQGAVGVALLAGRLGHRRDPAIVFGHVGCSVVGLGPWVAFLVTDEAAWGWSALGLITVGNTLGDALLRNRWRGQTGSRTTFVGDYARAIGAVVRVRMPGTVVFHALFAGVVWFDALGACIAA